MLETHRDKAGPVAESIHLKVKRNVANFLADRPALIFVLEISGLKDTTKLLNCL